MDARDILRLIPGVHPVGMGGCRVGGTPFDACEYNVTVFDNTRMPDSILECGSCHIRIHHGSLNENDSGTLIHYRNMRILRDESWDLRTFLLKLEKKWDAIYRDHARDCLIRSALYSKRAQHASDPFAQCWLKSAASYLADAVIVMDSGYPSPAHSLDMLRRLEGHDMSPIPLIHEAFGIQRATQSLLERMTLSTMGFSDKTEANGHSAIIRAKSDHMIKNSMLADCYMYLVRINRINLASIPGQPDPALTHILYVAFDTDSDLQKTTHDAVAVRDASYAALRRAST